MAQLAFARHHDMINAFSADRTDQPFCGLRFAKVNEQASGDPTYEYLAVSAIAVPYQVTMNWLAANAPPPVDW